jgi:hypothetical protein
VSIGHDAARLLFGGYLLGGLDRADRDALDAHLAGCPDCRREITHLDPVPQLLRAAPDPARVAPMPDGLEHLLRQVRAERADRRTRTRWLAVAAAIVVAVAFGLGLLLPRPGSAPAGQPARSAPAQPGGSAATAPGGSAATPPTASQSQPDRTAPFASLAGGRTSGAAQFTAKPWGTSVFVELTNLPPDGPYALRLSGRDGSTEQAATWGVTPSGTARVTGASSMPLTVVRSAAVVDREGRVVAVANVPS